MKCHCNPKIEPFEFQISDNSNKFIFKELPEIFPIKYNICEMKTKIIQEYLQIINKLECGIQENLELLLEEISLIDILENE